MKFWINTLIVSIFFTFFFSTHTFAQKENETPQKITVLEEHEDSRGNTVRTVQFYKGGMKVTQTIISPRMPGFNERTYYNVDTMNKDSMLVYIDKTNYLVALIYKRKRIRQYRAVFGPDRLKDKMYEGDRCTPEGWFKILSVGNNPNWGKFILLNYPNNESIKRYNERKSQGLIPNGVGIGHSIGIHGTYPTGSKMVELGIGWTDGCISLTTKDVLDFYRFVAPGVRVYIKR